MKRLFFVVVAAVAMLATSCSKDDTSTVVGGEKSTVTFAVAAPELATRAEYGDGYTATHLTWGVYDANGNYLENLSAEGLVGVDFPTGSLSTSVKIDLVNGKEYKVIFWAGAEGAPYTVNFETKKMTVNDALEANAEAYDAFYKHQAVSTVEGPRSETVTLTRPFAQLNIATADTAKAADGGLVVDQTQVVVNAYKTLDLADGTVADEVERTYTFAAIPANNANGYNKNIEVGGKSYDLLSMNYLLVNTKEVEKVTFTVKQTSNGFTEAFEFENVPFQRNYKTNIIGNILTSTLDFEITIDPIFEEYEYGYVVTEEGGQTIATVSTPSGLAQLAEDINDGKLENDTNIVLDGDIDLSSLTRAAVSNWKPIGTEAEPFTGTFDGKGFSIKNLTIVETEAIEGKAFIGFFGYAKNATIKNVVFENVNLDIPCLDIDHSQGHIGAVAGSLEGTSTIENVTVKGDIKVYATQDANGASRVAVVAGGNSYGNVTMKNVHVIANEGSYLKANNNAGALAGQLQGKNVFENCSSNIDVTVNKFFAGGIIGLAAGDSKFVDCHTTGDIAVVAGRTGRAHDQYRVGGIAGGWADGAKNVCTLENCSYTGNISGENSDGSVANPLDYMGYVGRGYTLNGCQGSTVVIDGIRFVQKYNTADEAGIYTINGCTPVSTADELIAALEANEGVYLLNDIKIEPAAMSNAYGATGINVKNGQTIDGGGHTLNIKGAGGTWDSGINTTGGIIRNITVTGSFRGIFINHTSSHSEKVVLENVTLRDVTYTISCDQGLYQTIEANNCSFFGWTSFAKTAGEAKFVDCYFGQGSGYKYCRPYSNTEFVRCTFCPGYAVDTTRATVTFTDCIWEE